MSSKGKCILRKRKEMLHEKLNQITRESENAIDLIQDMQIWATSIVSDLVLETDEHEFLVKYPTVAKKLEEWQAHISQISYELDVLVCEENRRAPEESDTPSTTSQHEKEEVQYKGKEVHSSVCDVMYTIPCPLQENDILDMRYISGDTPHDFWLRFYSTEELKDINSGIQKLFEEKKLQPFKFSDVVAGDVCVCSGNVYFRGRVISQSTDSPMSYSILNVDSGSILKVERDKIYHLTKELAKFQVQAINCCLEGVLGDPVLWDDCVIKQFHQIMEDSSLVVTICSVPTETCSKFVVKVDAHNKMHVESKIDLSNWITYSVLPVLKQRRTGQTADTLKSLLTSNMSELENSSLLMENSTISQGSKHWNMEKEERNLNFKERENGTCNNDKEKPRTQQRLLGVAQESSSFLSLNVSTVHAVSTQKEISDMQQSPTSAPQQQSNSFLSLSNTSSPVTPPPKEKPNAQQSPASAAQQSDSFLSLRNTTVQVTPPPKEKSNMQQSPTSTVQQSNAFLNRMPKRTMSPHKDKPNMQQWPPSPQQQSNTFLSLRGTPLHTVPSPGNQYVPNFLPYQNPPMLLPMGPPPPVSQAVYPYTPHMLPPSFLSMPNFSNALQQRTQPQSFQLQIPSPPQNKLLLKQVTPGKGPAVGCPKLPQNNAQDIQVGRGCRTRTSLEIKQKESMLVTDGFSASHNKMEKASAIKQTPSNEVQAPVREDASICKQETSLQVANSRSTNGVNRVSLRQLDFIFDIGARYKAFVVHINDPDDFYVHIASVDTAFIENLDAEMTENYTTCSVKLKSKQQAKMMLYESWCAVFYEDEHLWHRGKVIDWMDGNNTTVKVQYVDYGEVREVDLSMIKPLKAEYTKLPICATRCRLAKIHPPSLQGTRESSIWPAETIELFKVLAVRDKLHSIIVTDASTDPISVLLVSEDNIVINKALLDYEYAVAFEAIDFDPSVPFQLIKKDKENVEKVNGIVDDKLTENSWKENKHKDEKTGKSLKTVDNSGSCQKVDDKEHPLQNWDPMTDDFFSVDNTEYRDDENACYAVSGYIPKDEQRICKFYAENGHCFKGAACTKEHSMPNPDGWTTDRETVLNNTFNSFVLPPVGTVVAVEATAIYTVNMFNAHIHWEGRIKEGEETLITLNKYINEKENVSKMKRPHITPAVGQLVLAKFAQDGISSFFRARVIDTNIEEHTVQVVYIDYGNIEWVSEKDIREMEPQYLHLPPQAVECYVSNVNPKTDSEEALQDVSELILGKQLVGTLTSKDVLGHAEVELWDGDQKIANKLIEKGYADYRESLLFSKEDSVIIPG